MARLLRRTPTESPQNFPSPISNDRFFAISVTLSDSCRAHGSTRSSVQAEFRLAFDRGVKKVDALQFPFFDRKVFSTRQLRFVDTPRKLSSVIGIRDEPEFRIGSFDLESTLMPLCSGKV